MTEQIVDVLLTKSGLRTKPRQAPSSFGICIGHIDRLNRCWELIGDLRNQFDQQVFPEIQNYLESIFECGQRGECLTVSVYLIGKTEKSARPTVLFISGCYQTRKDARKAIKDSGLLSKFPNFTTAEIAKDPGLAAVCGITNASRSSRSTMPQAMELLASNPKMVLLGLGTDTVAPVEVFYDASKGIRTLGQAIYIKHSAGLRMATANLVRLKDRVFIQTVHHAFLEPAIQPTADDKLSESNNGFEMDSDVDDDDDTDEESLVATTSIASRSSESLGAYFLSDEECSVSSSPATESSHISSALQQGVQAMGPEHGDNITHPQSAPYDCSLSDLFPDPILPQAGSLTRLGVLWKYSVDRDWALIRPTDAAILYIVTVLKNEIKILPAFHSISRRLTPRANITIWTASSNKINGTIVKASTYIRLPGSALFSEVFKIHLNDQLAYGDCGSVVLDVITGDTYGHIVAGSRATAIAYIVAAHQVTADFQDIRDAQSVMLTFESPKSRADIAHKDSVQRESALRAFIPVERVFPFRLELHLPYLTLRTRKASVLPTSERHPLRKTPWSDLSFLGTPIHDNVRANRYAIYDAYTTIVIFGQDRSNYTGYIVLDPGSSGLPYEEDDDDEEEKSEGLEDDDDEEEKSEDLEGEPVEDQYATVEWDQFVNANVLIQDPRMYFLRAVQIRATLVLQEYDSLIKHFQDIVYIRIEILCLSPTIPTSPVQAPQALSDVEMLECICRFRQLLRKVQMYMSKTILAWKKFSNPHGDITYFKDLRDPTAATAINRLRDSFEDLAVLELKLILIDNSLEESARTLEYRHIRSLTGQVLDLNLDTCKLRKQITEIADESQKAKKERITWVNIYLVLATTSFIIAVQYFASERTLFYLVRNPQTFFASISILMPLLLVLALLIYAIDRMKYVALRRLFERMVAKRPRHVIKGALES